MYKPDNRKRNVLGIYPEDFVVTLQQMLLVDFGLLQARGIIALSQKSKDIPSVEMWTKELAACVASDKLTCIVERKDKTFACLWSPYMKFLETHNFELFGDNALL